MGGTLLIATVKYVWVLGGCGGSVWVRLCGCVGVIVWVGVGVFVWVRKGVFGGTLLIAAVRYVRWGEVWGECVGVIVWVGVGVIAWVRECVGGTLIIAAVKYVRGSVGVCVGVTVCVCGCDCVGEDVSLWVVQS